MTNREICERLIAIHNRLFHEYAMADGIEDLDLEAIGKDIGSLLLDLAAPETEEAVKERTEIPRGKNDKFSEVLSTKEACCKLYKSPNGECSLDCPLCLRRRDILNPSSGDFYIGCVADKWGIERAYEHIMNDRRFGSYKGEGPRGNS